MSVIEAAPTAPPGASSVWLDDDGLLRAGRAWVALPDHEWKLIAKLLERPNEIVHKEEIARCVWPGKDVSAGALRAAMIRLRRRVASVGVRILTVRGRGFILTIDQRGSE
jgi:two-component system, OmpR family, response regulator TctD